MKLRDIQQTVAEIGYASTRIETEMQRLRRASTSIVAVHAAARRVIDAFGGDVPEWLQADVAALETALAGE